MTLAAHDELLPLVRDLGFTVYDGGVPALPKYPYILVGHRVSRVAARALSRDRHARRVSFLLTLAGASETAVHVLAEACDQLDGQRVQGQRLEVEAVTTDVEADDDVAPNGQVVYFAKLTASLTLPV